MLAILINEEHSQVVDYLREVGALFPDVFMVAAEYALSGELMRELGRATEE